MLYLWKESRLRGAFYALVSRHLVEAAFMIHFWSIEDLDFSRYVGTTRYLRPNAMRSDIILAIIVILHLDLSLIKMFTMSYVSNTVLVALNYWRPHHSYEER